MGIDAVIISDIGEDSFSGTNPLRLKINGRTADIQVILNYLQNQGQLVLPIRGDGVASWSSASKLNGIYLFSYLTQQGFNVELIDKYYKEKERFRSLLRETPRTVIISTTFIHDKKTFNELVNDIRSLAPDIFIVAGGPFVFLSYQILQRFGSDDNVVKVAKNDFLFLDGEEKSSADLFVISLRGERILCDALRRIVNNQPIVGLPNVALPERNNYVFNKLVDDFADAKNIVIDWKSLPSFVYDSGIVPMQASNGCPYRCAFCNFTKDRRLKFIKPIDKLLDEMKAVSDFGVRYIWFVDDNFRLGSHDLESVCKRFIDADLRLNWMSFVRASALRDVDGELLRRSGCVEVQLGLESADPQVLRNMDKRAEPALYSEVIKKLLAAGINCSCYFLFGFPGETAESARRTREFIKSIEHSELDGVVSFSLFPFILAPLSPIYESDMREKYGLTGHMFHWQHRTMDSGQAIKHVMQTFLELENSGPIYRGDNLDILHSMSPQQRKKFAARRHEMSKLAMKRPLESYDIVEEFKGLFEKELLKYAEQ